VPRGNLDTREEAYADRYMAEDPDSEKAEALLAVLGRVRAERKAAEPQVRRAQAELDAVRDALAGDSMAVALRALKADLRTGAADSVADFNRRLREHFEAFVIDADGTPIPLWRVQVPATVAAHVAGSVDHTALGASIARRVEELGLGDLVETGEGFQALAHFAQVRKTGAETSSSHRLRGRADTLDVGQPSWRVAAASSRRLADELPPLAERSPHSFTG
jgi:hypothetical protein